MKTAAQYIESGVALCNASKFKEAHRLFEKAMTLFPSDRSILYNLIKVQARLDMMDEALVNMEKLVQIDPDNAEILSERGVLFFHMKKYDEALADLDYAVKLDPENPFRYSSRAWVRAKAGNTLGAIADYDKAIELDPEDAISYNNKGLLEQQLGYDKRARKSFEIGDQLSGGERAEAIVPPKKDETEEVAPNKHEMTSRYYLQTIKSLITSPAERSGFISYLKKQLGGKS